jgi:hypothetical protein
MKRLAARLRPLWLVVTVLLGCDGGTNDPSGPSLRVSVLGLPNGSAAAVTVSGPGGYSQSITATQTLTGLTPGPYSIAATSVSFGPSHYSPSPANQTVTVGSAPATASIFYTTAHGNLGITIDGLGTASTAAVTVTGPGGYTRAVGATSTLAGLNPGTYTVTARDTLATGGTPYTASPPSQDVSVAASATATAVVTYDPPPNNGTVNLKVAGLYLTQSAQNYSGSVPLVKSRNGYLRVFVVASRLNTAAPSVRVRYYNALLLQDSVEILPPSLAVPTTVDESSLAFSWNVSVPASRIQPGLAISAEVDPASVVDPDGAVIETDETDNVYPAAAPLALDVRTVPTLDVTFVPILQQGIPAHRRVRGNVTDANKAEFLSLTQKMHPIAAYNAVVHADYTTTTMDTLRSDNGNNAWSTILGEVDAVRVAEHSPRYYYGVARVSYPGGVAGVAYVSNQSIGARAALGWDYLPSGSEVVAHELGHNWARSHAPCGGPMGIDQGYPRADGSIGIYGVDLSGPTPVLAPPSNTDIMGYCDDKWISDYTYLGVMNYLISPSPPILNGMASSAVQPTVLVWGHIRDGELVLEPAFQVNTRPSLPTRPGPYFLEGRSDDGSTLFAFSFSPNEVADAVQSQQNFVFAVPLSASRAGRLSSLSLTGGGRQAISRSAAPTASGSGVNVRPVARGVALRWNAGAHPMVMVRDPATGQILSFARGGEVELRTPRAEIDVLLSDGVKSRTRRVRATR